MLDGAGNSIGKRQVGVIRSREKCLVTAHCQQLLHSPGPIERELLLIMIAQSTAGSGIFASMSGVNDDHWSGSEQSWSALDERLDCFLQVERVHVGLPVDRLHGKAQMQLEPVPPRQQAARCQNKGPFTRAQ